jgi:hypothetical protein
MFFSKRVQMYYYFLPAQQKKIRSRFQPSLMRLLNFFLTLKSHCFFKADAKVVIIFIRASVSVKYFLFILSTSTQNTQKQRPIKKTFFVLFYDNRFPPRKTTPLMIV